MKSLFERSGGTYTPNGDYFVPNIALSPQVCCPIGFWGRQRKKYLKSHRSIQYNYLLLSGTLYSHLADINEHALMRSEALTSQFAAQEGITEQLKQENMMAWVGAMNSIAARVREIIFSQLIDT